MGCNCSKNTPPTGSSATRQQAQAAADRATADAAARAQTSTSRIGPSSASSGQTQTFALRTREGKVERYGSSLEARAERARRGGEIV